MDSKEVQKVEDNNDPNAQNKNTSTGANNQNLEIIMDLLKLSTKSHITNTDIILSIFEICTFNKRYNYECSNNTKSFWDRVVKEGILKKIFKNFKSETLRKYWKIMRLTGNNEKYMEIVRENEDFINNNGFKLLPIINTIATYVTNPPKNQNFPDFFIETNPKEIKEMKEIIKKEVIPEKLDKVDKINRVEKSEKETIVKDINEQKIKEMEDTIEKLMKITNSKREEVFRALYGCTGNIKNTYLYLMDNKKYEKYFFFQTDDYIIKNLKNKNFYIELLNKKGEDNVKEREKFLKKRK